MARFIFHILILFLLQDGAQGCYVLGSPHCQPIYFAFFSHLPLARLFLLPFPFFFFFFLPRVLEADRKLVLFRFTICCMTVHVFVNYLATHGYSGLFKGRCTSQLALDLSYLQRSKPISYPLSHL
ncbi:hypothetical protein F4774DRAFT_370147 [Daldinia eschscholtzii]|nr:hypothetical protein F4774DRAFT_370147 [Daldinia eschscholtzii]